MSNKLTENDVKAFIFDVKASADFFIDDIASKFEAFCKKGFNQPYDPKLKDEMRGQLYELLGLYKGGLEEELLRHVKA